MFDAFVMVDWSAASSLGRKGGQKDGLWAAVGEPGRPDRVVPFRSRSTTTAWVIEQTSRLVGQGYLVLVGLDFAFGYPEHTALALGEEGPTEPWLRTATLLQELITDTDRNANNRFEVGAALNARFGRSSGPFWGRPPPRQLPTLHTTKTPFPIQVTKGHQMPEFRHAEIFHRALGNQPKSVWQLMGAGAVGSQTMMGLPALLSIRRHPSLANQCVIWPFETGFVPPDGPLAKVVLAEVYPSLVPTDLSRHPTPDAAQVLGLVATYRTMAQTGELPGAFAPPSLPPEVIAAATREEGWILPVSVATESRPADRLSVMNDQLDPPSTPPARPLGPSSRGGVAPFVVMEVMRAAEERAAAGEDVLHLEVGQPMTPAPRGVRRAAAAALETERLGYTGALGLPALRARIAEHYSETYGVAVDPDLVVATTGASGGFVVALLAAFDVGDRVAMTYPGYAAYRNIMEALGLRVVPLRVDASTRWVATPGLLAAAGPLDGVVIASPSNPTGTVMTAVELAAIADWCSAEQVRLISDEIYHGITSGDPAPTALTWSTSTVVVQSFSKYYSMTGWRLGWNVVPPDLRVPVERLSQNLYICPPALSQVAAVAAFDCRQELDDNVQRYADNVATLRAALMDCGLDRIAATDGAFYLWVDVSDLTNDSVALSTTWLADIGVAATPGVDFDPELGHRWMRFSVSESPAVIAEAGRRIADWVGARPARHS